MTEPKPNAIALHHGVLRPANNAEAARFAEMLARSEMVPTQYRGKPENILVAADLGAALGLSMAQSLQRIMVTNGMPSVWGDAIPAILRGNGYKLKVKATGSIEDGDYAVVAEVTCPNGDVEVADYSIAKAKRAGLWGKPGPWTKSPDRMVRHRAVGFASRDSGALVGLMTVEEAMDVQPMRDITPQTQTPPAEILAALAEEPEEVYGPAEAWADGEAARSLDREREAPEELDGALAEAWLSGWDNADGQS